MWSLLLSGMSSVGGLLAMLAVVASLVGVGAYEEHKHDEKVLQAMVLEAKNAAATEQHQLDQTSMNAAASETAAQTALSAKLAAQLKTVGSHVTAKSAGNCITYGLVRVLDGAVLGLDPGRLNLPTGATDASCAPVTALDLANSVVSNYGRYQSTAQRLTALQSWVNKMAADTQKGTSK